jgi:hypothetical protein
MVFPLKVAPLFPERGGKPLIGRSYGLMDFLFMGTWLSWRNWLGGVGQSDCEENTIFNEMLKPRF